MAAEGRTPIEMAVACAYRSRLGLGASTFHQGGKAGPADTVYLGVFRRAALERVGGFDETMHRAQDWELNYRIRKTGGLIWFSPDLSVTYRPRSSLSAVAKQFFHTGQWRREVIRRHPETANKRYLAPPVAVILLAVGTILGIIGLATGEQLARPRLPGPARLRVPAAGRLGLRGPLPALEGPVLDAAGLRHHARLLGSGLPGRPAREVDGVSAV